MKLEIQELILKTESRLIEFRPKLDSKVAEDIKKNVDAATEVVDDPKNKMKPGKFRQTLERLRNVGVEISPRLSQAASTTCSGCASGGGACADDTCT